MSDGGRWVVVVTTHTLPAHTTHLPHTYPHTTTTSHHHYHPSLPMPSILILSLWGVDGDTTAAQLWADGQTGGTGTRWWDVAKACVASPAALPACLCNHLSLTGLFLTFYVLPTTTPCLLSCTHFARTHGDLLYQPSILSLSLSLWHSHSPSIQ